jgi:hypothetical protein
MATTIQITATRVIFNGGQFDSNYRYLRETSSGAVTTLVAGPSLAVSGWPSHNRVTWRFQVGSYVMSAPTGGSSAQPAPSSVSNTPTDIAL